MAIFQPTISNKEVDIALFDGSNSITYNSKFLYDYVNTPRVDNILPNKLNVIGNEQVILTGYNLPTNRDFVLVGNVNARIVSKSSTQIVFISPRMNPGIYEIIIPGGNFGNTL